MRHCYSIFKMLSSTYLFATANLRRNFYFQCLHNLKQAYNLNSIVDLFNFSIPGEEIDEFLRSDSSKVPKYFLLIVLLFHTVRHERYLTKCDIVKYKRIQFY